MHKFTAEQMKFLRDEYTKLPRKELCEAFNQRFYLALSCEQVVGCLKNHKIMSGRTGRFVKGRIPLNKGKKGISYPGMEATQFKVGNVPPKHKPVGSERIDTDGYIKVKVAEPKKWRHKHVLVWENANGPVPPGCVVIILDGNKQNIEIDNLQLTSRAEIAVANSLGLLKKDAELTKTGLLIAQVRLACGKKKKREQNAR